MLSNQTSNLLPGRQQRQNSTPTVFNTPKTFLPAIQQQHEPHRRGLSIDQSLPSTQIRNELFQQDETLTEDEYHNRQRLIQALMREVQQQHSTARPGHEQPAILTRSTNRHSLSSIQQAPCQEHGTGFFMGDQPNIPMTAWENSSSEQHSQQDPYNSNTMDMFQSFDSTTSAGYLDGFGTGHDEYTRNTLPNETTYTKEMPHGMPSEEDSQKLTTSDGTQRPCTPLSQTRTSQ